MSKDVHITDEQVEEMRRTGDPLFVPIEGDGEVVVQDAAAYRRMLETLDRLDLEESARICRERLAGLRSGKDKGLTIDEFMDELHKRLGLAG